MSVVSNYATIKYGLCATYTDVFKILLLVSFTTKYANREVTSQSKNIKSRITEHGSMSMAIRNGGLLFYWQRCRDIQG